MRIVKHEIVEVYNNEWDILQKAETYIENIRRECTCPELDKACSKLLDAFCDVMDYIEVVADD